MESGASAARGRVTESRRLATPQSAESARVTGPATAAAALVGHIALLPRLAAAAERGYLMHPRRHGAGPG